MPVSPSFPAPGFPEFPQADEPRHDAVSPSFPEFPHQFPHPVPPRPFMGRGNGETLRGTDTGQFQEPTSYRFPNLSRAMEALS